MQVQVHHPWPTKECCRLACHGSSLVDCGFAEGTIWPKTLSVLVDQPEEGEAPWRLAWQGTERAIVASPTAAGAEVESSALSVSGEVGSNRQEMMNVSGRLSIPVDVSDSQPEQCDDISIYTSMCIDHVVCVCSTRIHEEFVCYTRSYDFVDAPALVL